MGQKKTKRRSPVVKPFYAEGGIHINPEHEGDFTRFAQSMGTSVQAAAAHVLAHKDQYSPARVKQANFARNAAGWKHRYGGGVQLMQDGGDLDYNIDDVPQDTRRFYYNDPKVDSVLQANRHLNFVDRYLYPNKYPVLARNPDGTERTAMDYDERKGYSTHSMMDADNLAFPTVVQLPDGTLKRLAPEEAYRYALKTGEFIKFPTNAAAQKFAANGYKYGMRYWQQGGRVSTEGYKADSPDRFNAFNLIPSNQITMQNVPHPVIGVDNLGNQQVMLPGANYFFPGQAVLEVPVRDIRSSGIGNQRLRTAQQGGTLGVIPPFTLDTRLHESRTMDSMLPADSPVFQQKHALDTAIGNREVLSRTPAQQAAYMKQYVDRQLADENRKEWLRQQELNRREKAIGQSDAIQDNTSLFSPERWSRKNLAVIAQATPERGRLFPDSVGGAGEFFDDYINPLVWVGNLAKGLGEAPLQAQQSNSVMPYVRALGTPLVAGALGINPVTTITNPIKGVFISKGLTGQVNNLLTNVVESNAVSNVKDKAIEGVKQILMPTDENSGRGGGYRYGGGVRKEGLRKAAEGGGPEPVDQTEVQRKEVLLDLMSPEYLKRLQQELGRKDVKDELDARMNNVLNAKVAYNDGMPYPDWGVYIPKHPTGEVLADTPGWKLQTSIPYKPTGLNYDTGWRPMGSIPDPYNRNVPGTVYLEDVFRPGNKAPVEVATTPWHEFWHVADDGVTIPYSTDVMVHRLTNPGTAPLIYRRNGITSSYLTSVPEVRSRKHTVEKVSRDAGIYDSRTQMFTKDMYRKMINNPEIQKNSDYQELYNSVKGEGDEKMNNFIELMNGLASRSNGADPTMARYGGRVRRKYQEGGQARRVGVIGKDYLPMGKKDGKNLFYKDVAVEVPMATGTGQGGPAYEDYLRQMLASGVSPEELVRKRLMSKNMIPSFEKYFVPKRDIVYTDAPAPVPVPVAQPQTGFEGSELYYPNQHLAALYKYATRNSANASDPGTLNSSQQIAQMMMVDNMGRPIPSQYYEIPAKEFSNRFTNGVKTLRDTTGISQYRVPPPMQVGGIAGDSGIYPYGMINPFDVDPYRQGNPFGGAAGVGNTGQPQGIAPTGDTGLYPYGAINPFDMDPYSLSPNDTTAGNVSAPTRSPGSPFRLLPIPGYNPVVAGPAALAPKVAPDTRSAAVLAAGQPKPKPQWVPNVGATASLVRGMAMLNTALESGDRNRYKQQERIRNLGDNKGALLPADWEERKGDYDVNNGGFRFNRMIQPQFGVAQMGGFFSEAKRDVPVMPAPALPVLPDVSMPSFDPAEERGDQPEMNIPSVKANERVKPNDAAWNAFNYYVNEENLPPHVAAGIVGNLAVESSGFNPDVISGKRRGDHGTAYYIPQLRGGRQKDFTKWAERNHLDPLSEETQLAFVRYEADQRGDLAAVKKAKTASDAAILFGKRYERPADKSAQWDMRAGIAEQLYNQFIQSQQDMAASSGESDDDVSAYNAGGEYTVTPSQLRSILANGGEVEYLR